MRFDYRSHICGTTHPASNANTGSGRKIKWHPSSVGFVSRRFHSHRYCCRDEAFMRGHKDPSWIYGAAASFSSGRRDNNDLTSWNRFPCKVTNSLKEKPYIQRSTFRILIIPQTHGQQRRKHKSPESRRSYIESLGKLDTLWMCIIQLSCRLALMLSPVRGFL